jgi:peptidoglycan/xylan/chitin deacetylase (PgdA/CDA1 family)
VHLPWKPTERLVLGDELNRLTHAKRVKRYLKALEDVERRQAEDELVARLDAGARLASLPRQMLTWEEVRSTLGLTRYGGHTHTHPILARLSPADIQTELVVSRDRILAETGQHPRWFAYPNGGREDIPEGIGSQLATLGYEAAFSTIEGANHVGVDRWALRRQPTGGTRLADFVWLVAA